MQGNIRVIRTLQLPLASKGIMKRLILKGVFAITSLFAIPILGHVDSVWASSWVSGTFFAQIKNKPFVLNVDDLDLEDMIDLKLSREDSIVIKMARIVYKSFYLKGDAITPISPGYVNRIVEKYVKPVNYNEKKIIQLTVDDVVIKTYNSVKQASIENQILSTSINNCLNFTRSTPVIIAFAMNTSS